MISLQPFERELFLQDAERHRTFNVHASGLSGKAMHNFIASLPPGERAISYRRMAAQTSQLAELAVNSDAKTALLNLSRFWRQLCEELCGEIETPKANIRTH